MFQMFRTFVVVMLAIGAIGSHAQVASKSLDKDAYRLCIQAKTTQLKDMVSTACWRKAQNAVGVVDDSSPEARAALACEEKGLAEVQVTDQDVQECRAAAQNNGQPQGTGSTGQLVNAGGNSRNTGAPGAASPSGRASTGTPANSPDQSLEGARAQASSDIAACTNLASTADSCCRNPSSCTSSMNASDQQSLARLNQMQAQGPQDGQSMAQYCQQMQQLQASTGNVYAGMGSVCTAKQSSCQNTCQTTVQKYESLLNSCANCAAASVYRETLATLNGKVNQCSQLQAQANQLSAQGINTGSGQGYASACQGLSSAQPSSLGGLPLGALGGLPMGNGIQDPNLHADEATTSDPYGCMANPTSQACTNCSANPSSEACRALIPSRSTVGTAGFSGPATSAERGQFNLPDNMENGNSNGPTFGNYDPQGSAHKVQPIANNSGGAIPAGDGAQGGARLNPTDMPRVTASALASGGSTDIMQGLRSGGGYTVPAGGTGFESTMRPSPVRRSPTAVKPQFNAVDLKNYLPGGSRDPLRRTAGLGGRHSEISGVNEDLFENISEKMREKCKLGILWECQP